MAVDLTERWDRVRVLFEGALEQPAAHRDAWIAAQAVDPDVRDEVASLVACHDVPHSVLDVPLASTPGTLAAGSQIGPYRIERLLGRGGMGAVYLASRADRSFERDVAIKVIGHSLDSPDAMRRFLAEREMLAGLDHPHIARLLDGGATTGHQPYFVMEYVDGLPIGAFCAERRLGLADRLRLFLDVAAAVQHAHERLVVHRDLKPDNILVGASGAPKLLDFGIAKLMTSGRADAPTTVHAVAMTPRYASPEQIAGGAIGTPSDIYSLGVLLYELLTGRVPHGSDVDGGWQTARAIAEIAPEAPSAAARQSAVPIPWAHRLHGDLDAILLMALRKEPERRYRSVDQFAEDIRRYLGGRPVAARPDTVGYRARKFVSRNRWASAAAALAVFALTTGVLAATWQARVARAAAATARAETARAQRVSEFLKTVIGLPDPSWNAVGAGGRHDMTVVDLLQNAGARIDREFSADPLMAADLHHAIGNTYRARGLYNDALSHFARALELRQATLPPNDPQVADSLFYYGAIQIWLGHPNLAQQYYEKAIAIERTLPFEKAGQLPYMLLDLVALPSYVADRARAEQAAREARDLFARHLGADHLSVGLAIQRLGDLRYDAGDLAGADQLLAEAATIFRRQHAGPLEMAAIQQTQAAVAGSRGDYSTAERLSRAVLGAYLTAYGPDAILTISAESRLAGTLIAQGRYAESAPLWLDVDRRARGQLPAADALLAGSLIAQARIKALDRRPGTAPLVREAERILDRLAIATPCGAGTSRSELARVVRLLHRDDAAVAAMTRAVEEVKKGCSPSSRSYETVLAQAAALRQPGR